MSQSTDMSDNLYQPSASESDGDNIEEDTIGTSSADIKQLLAELNQLRQDGIVDLDELIASNYTGYTPTYVDPTILPRRDDGEEEECVEDGLQDNDDSDLDEDDDRIGVGHAHAGDLESDVE
jgi:hypothetical protein